VNRPSVTSRQGMVAAAHPLAAAAGARVLSWGGNAFDAAVATAAALDVVEPYMSGMAGMGVATIYVSRERRVRCLDFIPTVPLRFDPDARCATDLGFGPHSVGPPGNLAGWLTLLDTYGSWSRDQVFADAIELARDGFPTTEGNVEMIRSKVQSGIVRDFVGWSDIFLDADEVPEPGWILRQPDLARTYEAIISDGADYLYRGSLGDALIQEIEDLGGALSRDDLASVEPRWIDPVSVPYRDLEVFTVPPPAEGFQMLLALGLLENKDLAELDPNGPEHLDAVIRATRISAVQRLRLANAPREVIEELVGQESLGRLRALWSDSSSVNSPTEKYDSSPPISEMPDRRREHTTSFSIADASGNMICLTQSLGAAFGSGIVVRGYGVTTNNFLYWGDLDPESPNHLYPGAPLSLPIAPTVSLRNGIPTLALGTPGSYGICQTQTQALLQHVDFGLDIQRAIEAPRMRVMDGSTVHVESRVAPIVIEALCSRGHGAVATDPWTMLVGGMQGVACDPHTGGMQGGADPRRDGYAIGVSLVF
jgi:gamma-glutamyltranspeptidase/glutathione hydrolase